MKNPTTEKGGSNRNTDANCNWDWFYGGGDAYWVDLPTALLNIPNGKRAGQTFAVNNAGLKEYWWPDPAALADGDVVLKASEGGGPVTGVVDANTTTGVGTLSFWTGTQAEFDALAVKPTSRLHIIPLV